MDYRPGRDSRAGGLSLTVRARREERMMDTTLTNTQLKSVTVDSKQLEELLTGAATHAHKDETLPVLNAVRLWANDGKIYAAATDRYRLIEGVRAGDGELEPVIIRLADVKRIITLAKGDKRRFSLPVSISAAGGLVSVAVGGDSLTLSAWDGTFPAYEHLIPTGETIALPVIQFNPALFADYAKIAGKGAAVGVRFYGEGKPMGIDLGEGWRALLMPMRKR